MDCLTYIVYSTNFIQIYEIYIVSLMNPTCALKIHSVYIWFILYILYNLFGPTIHKYNTLDTNVIIFVKGR